VREEEGRVMVAGWLGWELQGKHLFVSSPC
jgi:hypothetical protein